MSDQDSSENKPTTTAPYTPKPLHEMTPDELEVATERRRQVMSNVLKHLKPWLFEFGTWIFGGLLAFNLLVFASVILLAAEAHGILIYISLGAFVCALPVNVSGLFALRLIKDLNEVAIDDVMKQAFQDADVPIYRDTLPASDNTESPDVIRVNIGLRFSNRLLVMSGLLTTLGIVTALWYVTWWLPVLFLVMVGFSIAQTMNVVTRIMRPEVETNPELTQRYRDQYRQQQAALKKRENWTNSRR